MATYTAQQLINSYDMPSDLARILLELTEEYQTNKGTEVTIQVERLVTGDEWPLQNIFRS